MSRFLTVVGGLCFCSMLVLPNAKAQEVPLGLANIVFNMADVPEDVKAPRGGRGRSGSRGDCDVTDLEFTALIPEQEETVEVSPGVTIPVGTNVWGNTVSERPTFWFELSEVQPGMTLEFRLSDESGSAVHTGTVALPQEAGTFSVELPTTSPPLMADTFYYWSADLKHPCSADDVQVFRVDGWVQRVTPDADLTDQLATATTAESLVIYAAKGIWFDALTGVANLYQENPDDVIVQAAWIRLMEDVDLAGTLPPVGDR